MSTDWRALCEELADTLERAQRALRFEGGCSDTTDNKRRALIARARAALAAGSDGPASVVGEPSDKELLAMWFREDGWEPGESLDAFKFARAVLARYGGQPAPPAAGEVK